MKAPLIGGAYEARSYVADAQRCVNLYPEVNQQDAPFPTTHYLTPGLVALATLAADFPIRGVYTASNGELFVVCGSGLYYVESTWNATLLGSINPGTDPVSMVDNNTYLVVVDGTPAGGWTVVLSTHVFATWSDPNFLGGDTVQFLDTFLVLNEPGTQNWYHSDSNAITFNALAIAAKTDYQDLLSTILVNNQRVWAFGTQRATELWYNAGGSPFAFAQVPGVMIERACGAIYSPQAMGLANYWLGIIREGTRVVFRGEGQEARRVSNHALEFALSGYATVSDAVGWTYESLGHFYYVLSFPSADATWVFDETTGLWHEWAWADGDGVLHRHRGICHTVAYGVHVVGDHSNGKIYKLDFETYTDDGDPIIRIRSWPHFIIGFNWQKQAIPAEGKRLIYNSFMLEMQTGASPDTTPASPPTVSLRWSFDKGKSWGNPIEQSIGATGQYQVRPTWWRLGLGADVVFEASWSGAFATGLNGAYVDSTVLGT